MFLIRLYTEPEILFQTIEFKHGINFIFGKKDDETDPKKSLNGIGKSLLLDFIDFCLLADFKKTSLPRLHDAKEIIGYNKIILEFRIEKDFYVIKRDFINPDKVEFGNLNKQSEYTIKEVKRILCDLIFKRDNFYGEYSNQWLRKLLPFYIKIEQKGRSKYGDPIRYINEVKELELNQYHLFLMGINNNLSYENLITKTELKKKKPLLNAIEAYIRENYDLTSISEALSEADKIRGRINIYEKNISNFKIAEQYKDIENDANLLTERIKELLFLNYSDKMKLESFEKSLETDTQINPKRIQKLYAEFNSLLSEKIKKTLDDAINFRLQLSESRKDFLNDEIERLRKSITEKEQAITSLENDRSKLFTAISSKEAVADLSEAFFYANKEREKLASLESKIGMYTQLLKEIKDLEIREKEISREIIEYLSKIQKIISEFRSLFNEIYQAVYLGVKNQSVFDISLNDRTDAKLNIFLEFPADKSKGKNKGRTLIYDLFILFNSIHRNYNAPKFLIHDGIFDGMDKAHFVHLYEYLEEEKLKKDFQYIITLNEEGVLNQKFGHSDKVNPEKIAKEAIIVLTPSKKLLGREF